jgi:hypothetical protein
LASRTRRGRVVADPDVRGGELLVRVRDEPLLVAFQEGEALACGQARQQRAVREAVEPYGPRQQVRLRVHHLELGAAQVHRAVDGRHLAHPQFRGRRAAGAQRDAAGVGQPGVRESELAGDPYAAQVHPPLGDQPDRLEVGADREVHRVERDAAGVGQVRVADEHVAADARAAQPYGAVGPHAHEDQVAADGGGRGGQGGGAGVGEDGVLEVRGALDAGAVEPDAAGHAAAVEVQVAVDAQARRVQAGQGGAGEPEAARTRGVEVGGGVEAAAAQHDGGRDDGVAEVERAGHTGAGDPQRRDRGAVRRRPGEQRAQHGGPHRTIRAPRAARRVAERGFRAGGEGAADAAFGGGEVSGVHRGATLATRVPGVNARHLYGRAAGCRISAAMTVSPAIASRAWPTRRGHS